jgi:hypothetical protein
MSGICRHVINDASAWTSASLGGKEAITRRLFQTELDAIDELLRKTSHLDPQDVTSSQFTHVGLRSLIEELREVIMYGRSVMLVAGLSPDRYSPEELERIYWGIGLHLGVPAVQSRTGDRLGRVEQDDLDPVSRGYRSSSELHMHTDSYEIIGLMCIRKGAVGGQSALVSSVAIHNEIVKHHPEYLESLYEGFHMAIPEARLTDQPITHERIPVFCYVDGKLSCLYTGRFMHDAAEKLNKPLPGLLKDALDFIAKTAERDDLAIRFMLEPGEFMIWHNFLNLHSRTSFENDETHKRLLLRLWLNVPNGRPVVDQLYARGATYDRVYKDYVAKGKA